MSLIGKNLGVIDTLDMLVIDKTTGSTMFSGITTKAGIQQKTTAIDIWGGIGTQHLAKLRNKKEITVSGEIVAFDLNFFAAQNGVALTENTTGTLYFAQSNAVSSLSSTIAGAQMVYAVQTISGSFLNLVTTAPTSASQVQVTYNSGATGVKQVNKVTVTTAPTSSGNITVSFNNGTTTSKTVAVTASQTTTSVASAIASAYSTLTGWTVTSSGSDVIFTASAPAANTSVTITVADTGSTGIGSLTGTQVTAGVATTTSGATLTFFTGFSDSSVLVTFKAPPTSGKDSLLIKINAMAFPKNAEVLLKGIAYDYDTEDVVADIKIDFYKCSISPDFNLSFEMGKAISTPITLDVLKPSTIPMVVNGTLTNVVNTAGDLGDMFVDER